MFKLLVKKQITEMFRTFFYDPKKNLARSKGGIIGRFVGFAALIIVLMGGMFAYLAYNLAPMITAGYGWFYFVIFGGIGVIFGVFGSVFNTYSGLYLAKDNDLLLSMPIPPGTLVAARTFSVFLMALVYSGSAMIPASVIYLIHSPATVSGVLGSIFMVIFIAMIDFSLSCLLGWVVAKAAQKLKGRNIFKVIISLLFLALYYVVYFKAMDLIKDLVTNIQLYGDSVKGKAYPLYLFGRLGEGDPKAIAVYGAVMLILLGAVYLLLSKTFIGLATGEGKTSSVKRKGKNIKSKGVFGTLLSKEASRLKSNSTYMLNCALGSVFLLGFGIFMLIKGDLFLPVMNLLIGKFKGGDVFILAVAVCFISSMNFTTTPSVSLEGNSLWVLKSLPVDMKLPLFAKITLQFILTAVPAVIAVIMGCIALNIGVVGALFAIAVSIAFTLLTASLGLIIGINHANLNWVREIVPIKQSAASLISMAISFGIMVAFVGLYFIIGHKIGAAAYLAVSTAVFAVSSAFAINWINHRGAEKFANL